MADREQLYGLPLDRFIPERGALAKQLRSDGDRDGAAAVASLRKPSVAAWAVNQLVRSRRRDVKALFDAGDRLQKAQAQLLAGRRDGHALRQAVERERAAVDKLVELAGGLLSDDGQELTSVTRERVSETFHAAALDEQAREQVSGGCLVRELRHVGLGAGGELAAAAPQKRDDRERTGRLKAGRKAEADARNAARKAEADARKAAERAVRERQKAQGRRDRAASALTEAEQALAEAQSKAEAATRAHERAQRALGQL